MARVPTAKRGIVLQGAVIAWPVRRLTYKGEDDFSSALTGNREAYRVPLSIPWQPRTATGVTQVTKLLNLPVIRLRPFMARSTAVPTPTASQRQS